MEITYVPTQEEKQLITQYCNLSLKSKKITESTKEKVKENKEKIKSLREELQNNMKNEDIVVLPQEKRRKLNEDLVREGKPEIPCYIRKIRTNKDIVITNEIIQECVHNFNAEDIFESSYQDGPDALVDVIISNIKRCVRSFSETIKLSDAIPKGIKPADISYANDSLTKAAFEFYETKFNVQDIENEKRDTISEIKSQLKHKQPEIEKYFNNANLNSQRIILESCSYNLVRRQTIIKPKVNLTKLEEIVRESVNELITKKYTYKTVPNKMMMKGHVSDENVRTALNNLISSKILSLPSTTKSDIFLKRIPVTS